MVVQAVSDEDPAVGEKRHVLRSPQMSLVVARDVLFAQRHQQFAPIVGEGVDLMKRLVDHPHFSIGVVGAHAYAVRARTLGAFAQMVPVVPELGHLAVTVERIEAVPPHSVLGLTKNVDADRPRVLVEFGWNRVREPGFSALGHEDPVGRFGEHARVAAEGVAVLSEGLMPARDDPVGTGSYGTGGGIVLRKKRRPRCDQKEKSDESRERSCQHALTALRKRQRQQLGVVA